MSATSNLCIFLVVGWAMLSSSALAGERVSVADIKITFSTNPVPLTSELPTEAAYPPASDHLEHGAFTNVVAGRISALNVTWADPMFFKSKGETEDFLRQMLCITNSETWTFHIWSYVDTAPSIVCTVEHAEGKQGKWFVWCSPNLTCAYLDEKGKWWWGSWDTVPKPHAIDISALPWGKRVEGLELGAAVDSQNEVVHCWVRNGTTNEVTYNSFCFGYFEFVKLEVQVETNWVPLASSSAPFPGTLVASSAGPISGKIERLAPAEVIANTRSKRTYSPREDVLASLFGGDTFLVDLCGIQWPADVSSQSALPARISQSFVTPDGKATKTLYSPSFTIDVRMIPKPPGQLNYARVPAISFAGDARSTATHSP